MRGMLGLDPEHVPVHYPFCIGAMLDEQEHTGPNQHALLFFVEDIGKLLCTLTHALVGLSANIKSRSDTGHAP